MFFTGNHISQKNNWLLGILTLCAALIPFQAHAEGLATGQSYEVPILRLTVGLILCVLLAFIASISLKKIKNGTALNLKTAFPIKTKHGLHNYINIIETRRLSPHADVASFICEDKEYLVLLSAGHALLLNQQDLAHDPDRKNDS